MKRRPLIAGNWKMHNTGPEAAALAAVLRDRIEAFCDYRDVVVCPPATSLREVREALKESAISLGAQNMHWEETGAFTGEVSAPMLLTSGCTHVIIGHSERRQLFGDTDVAVNRKLGTALHFGLTPLVCIGETLAEREAGRTEAVVYGQLQAALKEIPSDDIPRIVIAYEPVWAIGTGKTATPEQADDVHRMIRDSIRQNRGERVAERVRILYGGSVKPDNAKDLFARENIDGGLVGGASLEAGSFAEIVLAAE